MKKMILLVVLLILSACTDYVAQIDDQIVNLQDTSGQAGELLTDSRDGRTYRTVVIGTLVWMAENLNYEAAGSYCYDDKTSNCTKYGRLYEFSDASGVCPSGWHLPSKEEWESLIDAVGGAFVAGKMLKAKRGWDDGGNGTNSFGFLALPGGYKGNMANNNEYKNIGGEGSFWTSKASYVKLSSDNDKASMTHESVYFKRSVRCVRDEPAEQDSSSSEGAVSSSKKDEKSSSSREGESSSSGDILMSSSSVRASWVYLNSAVSYGEMIDERDSLVYKTVVIGNQVWMAENLNYEISGSYCYKDADSNCAKYGRLYEFHTALKICPSNWHLPTVKEWETLFDSVGGVPFAGKMLKSTGGWYNDGNGTDSFGFTALPGGDKGNMANNGTYANEKRMGIFWTATTFSDIYYAYYVSLVYDEDSSFIERQSVYYKHSVRCVSDAPVARESSSSEEQSSSSKKDELSSSSKESESEKSSSSMENLPQSSGSDSTVIIDLIPVLGIDSMLLNEGRLLENDEDALIPVKLSIAPSTDVIFSYCFDVDDSGSTPEGFASVQDFSKTSKSKFPRCNVETEDVRITEGSPTPTEATKIYINVIKDALAEGDEMLILNIFNLSGAVLPGNKLQGALELTISDAVEE